MKTNTKPTNLILDTGLLKKVFALNQMLVTQIESTIDELFNSWRDDRRVLSEEEAEYIRALGLLYRRLDSASEVADVLKCHALVGKRRARNRTITGIG